MKGAVKRGEIYYVDVGPTIGSEQGGIRPAIVVSNDVGHRYSNVAAVVLLSGKCKPRLPTHVIVNSTSRTSTALCEQIRTLDKRRFKCYLCDTEPEEMEKIDQALKIALGLGTSWANG